MNRLSGSVPCAEFERELHAIYVPGSSVSRTALVCPAVTGSETSAMEESGRTARNAPVFSAGFDWATNAE